MLKTKESKQTNWTKRKVLDWNEIVLLLLNRRQCVNEIDETGLQNLQKKIWKEDAKKNNNKKLGSTIFGL